MCASNDHNKCFINRNDNMQLYLIIIYNIIIVFILYECKATKKKKNSVIKIRYEVIILDATAYFFASYRNNFIKFSILSIEKFYFHKTFMLK